MSQYNADYTAVGAFLNSDMLLRVVETVAEEIKGIAIAMSPVGSLAEGDEHPGLYIASWKTRSQLYGGATHDRAEAIVYNDSPDALYVEFGSYGREPYHVLLRAAMAASI
jgi:hypothetical protein